MEKYSIHWTDEQAKKIGLSFLENKDRLVQSVDSTGRFIFVNKKWVEELGYSKEEAMKLNFKQILAEKDIKHCNEIFLGLMKGNSYENVQVTFKSKKGDEIYLEANLSPVKENGKVISTIGILRDITQQTIIKKNLGLSNEIIKNMSEAVYLIGLNDFLIKYTNPKFEKMFGYKSGELLGKEVSIVNAPVSGTSPKKVRDDIVSLLKKQKEWHGEVQNIKKDGSKFWSYANVSLFNHPEYGEVMVSVHTDITERKRAEDEVKLIKELIDETSRLARVGGWELDLKTGKQMWTDEVYRIHELEKSFQPTLKNGIRFYAPEALPIVSKAVSRAIEYGESFDLELPFITAKKKKIFVHSIGKPIFENGKVVKLKGVFQDITEKKKSEERLKDSEERFYLAMKGANDGLWDWNILTNEVYFSPRWKSMLGYRGDEIPNKFDEWAKRIHPEDKERTLKYASEYAKGKIKGKFEMEFKMKHKNGSYIFILAKAFLVKNENGKPIRIVGTHTDITEKRTREEETEKQKSFFSSVVENIPNMVFVKDAKDLRFELFNKAGEELLGTKRESLLGKNDYDFFPKHQADFFIKKDKEVLSNKKLLDIPKEPIKTPWGEKILHTKKIPIISKDGKPIYLLGISEDITGKIKDEESLKRLTIELDKKVKEKTQELQNALDQLKSLDSAKTEFLSITSHELRSPMTPMKAQLQMLLAGYLGALNSKQTESIDIVLRNTERLDKIIVDLLDISRIEAARLKFIFIKTNLIQEINRLAEEIKGFMPEKKIDIKWDIKKLPVIECDPDRIMQCLRNLLTNAIKFSNPGRDVVVSVSENKDNILFSVKDSGVGIKENDQKRIFEPFYQAEQTIYREHQGTGLGLAIVQGIVQSQGGKVWFDSKYGKGSEFYFTFPKKPVIDVKPISLLFSASRIVEPKVKDVLVKYLNEKGEKEFEKIKKENLSYEGIIHYLESLADSQTISQKEFFGLSKEIKEIYLGKKENKI